MGSFYIPLIIIIVVYIQIFQNTRQRLRKRAKASNLTALKKSAAAAATSRSAVGGAINSGNSKPLKPAAAVACSEEGMEEETALNGAAVQTMVRPGGEKATLQVRRSYNYQSE